MPTTPKHPCSQPGCPTLIDVGRYCERHARTAPKASRVYDQTTRRNDPALAWCAEIRNSSRWQKVRTIHRSANPLCCDPFKTHGLIPPLMAVVNHIVPLRVCYATGRFELAYDLDNLASLCTACDARIGAMERRGEDTTHLFNQAKEL